MEKRSVGVTVFGWLIIIHFVIPIIWEIVAMLTRKPSPGPIGIYPIISQAKSTSAPPNVLIKLFKVNTFLLPLLMISSFIGGIGLLRLKRWSRKFAVVIFSMVIISSLTCLFLAILHNAFWKLFFPKMINFIFYWLWLGFYIAIVIYFTRPKVKEQFR
jgi:hypothetical protein